MKRIAIMTLFTIFISCDADDNGGMNPQSAIAVTANHLQKGGYPENNANTYDAAGLLYSQITEAYIASGISVATAADVIADVELLAGTNPDFTALKSDSYTPPSASRVEYIANNNGEATAFEIISNSSLSAKGKLSLSDFIDTLVDYRDAKKDYDFIYPYIIGYESSVLSDKGYTATDLKIILTTTSISRYGFYLKKKRPRDRDWDISWGNITAGTEGSEESMAKAAVMSVATGIMTNK